MPASEVTVRTAEFDEVLALIEVARRRAYQAVNTELVGLYWQLGEYISRKIESAQWGDSVVDELVTAIARRYPGLRGYTRPNLFRMRQFYEAYRGNEKVSPLVRQLPWTHHLIILSQARPPETREFYMLAAIRQRWTKRELERQIRSGAALRAAARGKKVSPVVTQIHPAAEDEFKGAGARRERPAYQTVTLSAHSRRCFEHDLAKMMVVQCTLCRGGLLQREAIRNVNVERSGLDQLVEFLKSRSVWIEVISLHLDATARLRFGLHAVRIGDPVSIL